MRWGYDSNIDALTLKMHSTAKINLKYYGSDCYNALEIRN